MASHAHISRPLVNIIQATNARMRLAIANVDAEPSKESLAHLFSTAESLSGAVTALARTVPLDQLTPPSNAPQRETGGTLLADALRLLCLMDHGACELCGGALRAPFEDPETDE